MSGLANVALVPLIAIFLAGVGFAAVWSRARHRDAANALHGQIEKLHDEIWELKEAAAGRSRAEAASEAKSRFLATVSHEIRTPLSGILGMASLLADTPLQAEQRSYVEAISTSGAALASLIDEILDFSKIEAGKLEISETVFDLAALVEGVVELLAPRAQGKGLEIAASIDPTIARLVRGDPARLRQVLINLAGNAVKFTDAGGVGLRVSSAASGQTRFSVADTGIGIKAESREAIFEDFEQGDGSSARRHDGAGLGLAISRRIVERLGGELRLESTSAQGSVFSFAIPLPAAPSAAPAPGLAAAPGMLRLNGRRALIIGASPFEAPFLGERLAEAGALVLRADGEESAFAQLENKPTPDIVIVDCALGESATRRLAAAARAAGVAKSLVLFSPFERHAFGHAIEGFDGWLVKPVRSRSLVARLQDADAAVQRREPVPSQVAASKPGLGLRVLLAEDNPINALIATKHLERLGAAVTRVADGAQALEACERALAGLQPPFDLVLMDLRMPGLDGLSAAKRIRMAETQAAAEPGRIVALTANAFDEDRAACLAAGFNEFLTKPIDFERLGEILTELRSPPGRRKSAASDM
jgi:signal transduction histidine kinase/CheY-like chemotaxis protein